MAKDKKVKEPNIIGGDKSYNPNVEEKGVFAAKVKIGKKEFIIYCLNMEEIKYILRKLDTQEKAKEIKDNYDRTSFLLSEVINKCNPGEEFTISSWDKMVMIDEFEKIQEKIMDVSGLKVYFKVGIGKKL